MDPIQMVDLQRQYQRDRAAFGQGLQGVVDSTAFINGPAVKEFCKSLAGYLDVPFVLPCANGTDALQIALMALDLKPGDEVITVPFTFVATVEVVALLGLKPVFVDVDPDTFNMDPSKLEAAISSRTKAIIPVHLFGQPCDLTPILDIANQHGIPVIEDNAQATGADYQMADGTWKKAGTLGTMGTTSFYPTKNLGCWGDGGALFTRDEQLAKRLNIITNHGSDRKYYYDSIGVNSRLDSLQAAVLSVKLGHLDDYNKRRQMAAAHYDEQLKNLGGVTIPYRAPYSTHVYHQYTLKVGNGRREELREHLEQKKVPSMVYYPVPLHLSSAYQLYGFSPGDFPVSELLAAEVISLPMHSELDYRQLNYITETLHDFFSLPG